MEWSDPVLIMGWVHVLVNGATVCAVVVIGFRYFQSLKGGKVANGKAMAIMGVSLFRSNVSSIWLTN